MYTYSRCAHTRVWEVYEKKIQFSIYGFIMTESPLKQIDFSSNAVTVCNMFLFRLFVRRICYYCLSLVLTNAGLRFSQSQTNNCKRGFSVGSCVIFNKGFVVDMAGGDAATTGCLLTSCSGFTPFLSAAQETQTWKTKNCTIIRIYRVLPVRLVPPLVLIM